MSELAAQQQAIGTRTKPDLRVGLGSMRWRHLSAFGGGCLVPVILGSFVVGGSPIAEGSTWDATLSPEAVRLLEEYPAHYERLKSFYANVRMEVVEHGQDDKAKTKDNPDWQWMRRYLFCGNGGSFFRLETAELNPRNGSPTGAFEVCLIRPEGVVRAFREVADRPLVVSGWNPDPSAGNTSVGSLRFRVATYSASAMPVYTVLGRGPHFPDCLVEKVVLHEEGGERLATVVVGPPVKDRNEWRRPGGARYVFYRDRGWALKETTRDRVDPRKKRVSGVDQSRCTYEGMRDGVPLLKSVRYSWTENDGEQKSTGYVQFDVVKIEPGPVPESEFTPEAVGIRLGAPRSAWTVALIVLVNGVLLLGIYFLLRRRERNKSQSPADVREP